jgi:hypothetical protein
MARRPDLVDRVTSAEEALLAEVPEDEFPGNAPSR